jgi:hypothetical protein
LKGKLSANHTFAAGDRVILLQTGLFSSVEETHAYLERKPSVLAAGASSILNPSELSYF